LLVERGLLVQLQKQTKFWRLDSPRICYESEPFTFDDVVAAYRTYRVGTVLLDGVGIGVSVDVGTAFFGRHTLEYYFDLSLPADERARRLTQFEVLTGRQTGQKGTLDHFARGHRKCYFESAPAGITCSSTGEFKVGGKKYPSLAQYYREIAPSLGIRDDEPAIRVSFPNLDLPVWIAARFARPRATNDALSQVLRNVDKIHPSQRRALLQAFWELLEPRPLGDVAPGLEPGFWQPSSERVVRCLPVTIELRDHHRVQQPDRPDRAQYRQYYRERLRSLDEFGCFSVPATESRTIQFAYPQSLGDHAAKQFAGDLAEQISRWTRLPFTTNLIPYTNLTDGIEQVRRSPDRGVAVVVLNDDPAAYYEVAFQLEGWRVKRVTEAELRNHAQGREDGMGDRGRAVKILEVGRAKWQSFVTMNALDVLQQMDFIPWRIDPAGPYDAQLVIDVGRDRRYVSLSLLVARDESKTPSFVVYTLTEPKADPKQEGLNPVLLADQIVKLMGRIKRRRFDPIESLLIMRDGRLVSGEFDGISRGVDRLRQEGPIASSARIDIVEFHKSTLKAIRLWEVTPDGQVTNALEGTVVKLSANAVLVLTTGMATVHQGTASPLLLVDKGHCYNLMGAAESVVASAQLNWSNPRVAQHLPLPFKRTDEELRARAAQEIRRIR
jgi:hypothetical protein